MARPDSMSSFLPTIKCSMCAADIEISQMGEHVCGGPPANGGEPTPPPDSSSTFDRMDFRQNPPNGTGFLKPGRALPPKVDTSAANRPFLSPDQLTPESSSTPRSLSPMTPSDGGSPYHQPLRSATAPVFKSSPSLDHLSTNLDSTFPSFPTSRQAPNRSQTQDPRGNDHDRLRGHTYAEADPMYAPVSPRTATTGGLLQRMNTIAPGPFDINRRKKLNGLGSTTNTHRRQETAGSLEDIRSASQVGEDIQRPSTSAGPGHSRTSTTSSSGSRSGIIVPKVPRNNGYGGFGPPPGQDDGSREPLTPENRSQTFPLQSESQATPIRRPSEPSNSRIRIPSKEPILRIPMEDGRPMRGSPPQRQQTPSMSGPDLTRPLPPRGASVLRPRGSRLGDAPPIPTNLNLDAEFGVGNPYHTPTESSSSNNSGYSEGSKASSRSSPPLSTGPGRSRRHPSDTTKMDVLKADLETSMSGMQPKGLSSTATPPRQKGPYVRSLQPPHRLDPSHLSPESPTDLPIQGRRPSFTQTHSPDRRNDERSRSPMRSPSPMRSQAPPLRSHSPLGPAELVQNSRRRPITSKGNCKGCGEPIKGKSISSADGRLTGRYHKECFVCRTCSEPFQTATFYVIDDAPYCERHYHKLNGSICHTCDRGIEGQYLESERKQKYHPNCLRCADCKRNLRHDYFEMKGSVYCERDAFRRAQQGRSLGVGGPSSRMERRTTRLMMM